MMTGDDCREMRLLIQADVDGELMPADTAGVEAHLERCPSCAALQTQLIALAARIRQEVPNYEPPDGLLAAVQARLSTIAPPSEPLAGSANDNRAGWWHLPRLTSWVPFGGGFALAACLALVFLLPRTNSLPDAVVSDHIRALQPGHLMDVVSTDQHTVKPWFDGRLNFAPPVKDLKDQGFPLAGGRLDYLVGEPVAALIYQRRQHIIDLYVWPDGGHFDHGPTDGSRSGYNYVHWSQNGMAFWAVSDLAADELAAFAKRLALND
jgi:anti-sigma factor RsiW